MRVFHISLDLHYLYPKMKLGGTSALSLMLKLIIVSLPQSGSNQKQACSFYTPLSLHYLSQMQKLGCASEAKISLLILCFSRLALTLFDESDSDNA